MSITFPDYNSNTVATKILENKNLKMTIKITHDNSN